jgi:general secretion pathway protein J
MIKIKQSCSGFTLLEILLAIFIFSIVISTIFGTFNAIVSKTDAIKSGMGDYEMARACLFRIQSDLSAIYINDKPLYKKPDFNDPPDPYRFEGKEEFLGTKNFAQLRFSSNEHLPMGNNIENGIAEIVYYVKEVGYPDSEFLLKRSDTLYVYDEDYEFEEKDSDPVLCENIETFSIIYFDDEGNEFETWDSESDNTKYATPNAVGINLSIKSGEETYSFYTKIILNVFREKLE